MKRVVIPFLFIALAACEPTIPDSAEGVGFSEYLSYETARIERERLLRAQRTVAPSQPVIASETIGDTDTRIRPAPATGAPLSAVAVAAPPAATSGPTATASVTPEPTAVANNPSISDEQDFQAVSARETIESDAERLARLSGEYQVIQPEALPTRRGDSGPNIVAFALSTTNQVGQRIYRRSSFNADTRFQRACARFATADEAQRQFLANGGPENDRAGVDPDGDGFACSWDPRPFRAARGG